MSFDLDHYQQTLFPYAYNILGSAEDARDIIQETMIKWQEVNHSKVKNHKAYLTRAVINNAINYKKQQHTRLRNYPGEWLPEPVMMESESDRRYILSYSLMVLLEQLNAKERAVFILKESFDFSHSEIADLLDITEDSSRQLLKRSRSKLKPEQLSDPVRDQQKLKQYTELIMNGDTKALKKLLAEDVRAISDGGKAPAARKLVTGITAVTKLITGVYRKFLHDQDMSVITVNHQPAILYCKASRPYACHIFTFDENGRISKIHIVVNPEKLRGLVLE